MPSLNPGENSFGNATITMNTYLDQQQYISTESLDGDHNSNTSSTEGSISFERRKDHEFIPTRMKTINASRPANNPQQFTKVPSNPLLISAQKQMLKVEEIKKAKELAAKQKSEAAEPVVNDEPDWQSELSSWKNRRRKQSEETLMRVAELKVLEESGKDPNRQKISLGKKLSGLLYSGEDDWSDLGLEKPPSSDSKAKSPRARSSSRSPIDPIGEEKSSESSDEQNDEMSEKNSKTDQGHKNENEPPLEKWTSSSSLSSYNREKKYEPTRRKSSEVSAAIKSRLEAFQSNKSESEERKRSLVDAPPEHEKVFKEKLETFRKISSQSELNPPLLAKGAVKPPPPLSYSKLIGNYQGGSTQKEQLPDTPDSTDYDKDLDDALEESYKSVLNQEQAPKSQGDNVYKQKDFFPKTLTPPSEKPPPPPPVEKEDEDVDLQEKEILASLEAEEREHKRYMELKSLSLSDNNAKKPVVPQPSGMNRSPVNDTQPPSKVFPQHQVKSSPPSGIDQPIRKGSSSSISDVPKKKESVSKNYNQHWLIQEAEQRRVAEMHRSSASSLVSSPPGSSSNHSQISPGNHGQVNDNSYNSPGSYGQPISPPIYSNTVFEREGGPVQQRPSKPQFSYNKSSPPYGYEPPVMPSGSGRETLYANVRGVHHPDQGPPFPMQTTHYTARDAHAPQMPGPQVPPKNADAQDRMLSISGKKKCSHCKEELGRGAAMIIESLRLYYHLRCFQCCVCQVQLGSGQTGTDVRVRNNKLHCQNCYSNDEGLKFSKV